MKKKHLKPFIQDLLICSAFGKFCILAVIDDYKFTWINALIYLTIATLFALECKVLIKYGGKKSMFIE